jgi:long-subunit acyl-CoA synthetase (AMP-forming)
MDVMEACAKRRGDLPAMKAKVGGEWRETSWRVYRDQVRTIAKAFMALGLEPGRGVSILGLNRPEWFLADIGAIYAGGVPTGIYTTNSAEQCRYIIDHSESAIVVVDTEAQLAKILEVRAEIPSLEAVVLMEGDSSEEGVFAWKELAELSEQVTEEELEARIASQKPEDLCTLIYTSGTTADPKGVMLSHENLTWTADAAGKAVSARSTDRMISYLPLSHIAEQIVSLHLPMTVGCCSWFAESLDKLGDNLREVRPTLFVAVPRVWEKIQAKMIAAGAQNSGPKKIIAAWARKQGLAGGFAEQRGEAKPLLYALADALVFSKVRDKLGLDQARLVGSTAAPISRDTLEFFLSLGVPIYEIYGQSECSGPATLSLPHRYLTGSAGPALAGTELKIAEDGEVCIRGPHVFLGYYRNEAATAEAIDDEGWLHSGDVGRINEDFLYITDRKKELIITAGGENIAPQMIEGKLKGIRAVAQAVVIGDRRKYLTVLLTLDPDQLEEVIAAAGSPARTLEEAATCDKLRSYLQGEIDGVNKSLARVQTVKRFVIIPQEFTTDGGELTPTMKLKRRVVYEKYAKEIESMYGE